MGTVTEGIVLEALPGGLFKVRCDDGREVIASFGAAAKRVTVKVIPGDRVEVELSPYEPTRGKIKQRR